MKYTLSCLLFAILFLPALAQKTSGSRTTQVSDELVIIDFDPATDGIYTLEASRISYTSLVVNISQEDSFEGSFIAMSNERYDITEDEHTPDAGRRQSMPVIIEEKGNTASIHLSKVRNPFKVYAINASVLPPTARTHDGLVPLDRGAEGCEEPPAVDQSEWRSGLSAPSYSRSFTETEHLIVHHSATSNSLTDYYNVVRNIYLYHTQVNGWSDIGYNYLIAPDGTIFKGRDPGTGEQDLVLGAHFCGRNSTTMGVCMIGDYRTTEPSSEALLALEALLAWKALKEDLDVFGTSSHPLNDELPTIAGHRQGCATECPGDQVFNRLGAVTESVAAMITACNDPLVAAEVLVYPNPSDGDLLIEIPKETEIEKVDLVTLSGQLTSVGIVDEGLNGYRAATSFLQPGIYVLRVQLKNHLPEFKKVVLR